MATDCLFCKIIAGSIPATIVYQDDRLTAIRDIHPVAPTHILVMPNRHLPSLAEAEPQDEGLLASLLLAAARLARQEGLTAGGYRTVINTGPDAGQSVPHLHVHLIGGRPQRWPPG